MLPMVPTATANPTRRHAVGESTSLSWRSRESMKLPSNQFQDADLACSAHVVNHVRHGYVRDGQHVVHETEPALDRVRDFWRHRQRSVTLALRATGNPNMTADGDWDLVVTTPLGERRGVLSLKTEGKVLLGRQTADGNSTEIFDGDADGTVLSWKISIADPMPMILKFSGSIEGDRLSGTVALGDFGDFSFSGTRVVS
jgi:hypothetical protein